jgi:predicted metal-dependent hydrolase
MKSRWGSCNIQNGNIRLNSELAKFPKAALEHVVVHELVHLLEPSHSKRFYSLMNEFLPNWKERKALTAVDFRGLDNE